VNHLTGIIILRTTTKVSVCQVPDIREDIGSALKWIEKFTREAEAKAVSLVCFPECFLQGYLTEINLAQKHAINFNSLAFKSILERLAVYKPAIVFGLIEKEDENLFNTAVVIKEGELVGKYRKTHLLPGEQIFKAGVEYPVFEIDGLKFGISICYDTQFAEAVGTLVNQGARLILCPSNNMMRYETAEKYKYLHHEIRIERVKENKVWLMSADITGKRESRIAYGPTSAIHPAGKVVAQVPLMKTGMIVIEL
jgi:predicted amidohydrolase